MQEFHSQYMEDKKLNEIFTGKKTGFCMEVGAYDGATGSTTLFFEQLGWDVVLVEPHPTLAKKIKSFRKAKLFECAVGSYKGVTTLLVALGVETLSTLAKNPEHLARINREGGKINEVQCNVTTMDDILGKINPSEIDFISIDVETYEINVLSGFDISRWKPRIVIIEDNSSGVDNEVPRYFKRNGYARFWYTGCNDWYCRANDREILKHGSLARTYLKKKGTAVQWYLKRTLNKLGMLKIA